MWYSKKLSVFLRSLNFIAVLASASAAIAADKDDSIEDSLSKTLSSRENNSQSETLSSQEEHHHKFGFGKAEFLSEERKLIEDRELNLWGVGLFSSYDIPGKIIRGLTASKWSHVGLILEDQKDLSRYCFESTGSPSQILKGILPQVQIHKWEEVVKDYNGKVAERQFKFSEQLPDWEDTVAYVNFSLGTSYETDLTSLIKAIRGENKEDNLSSVFCSEMVADCLIRLGYLDGSRLADNYVPGDFSSKRLLPWMNGASLGEEAMVKRKTGSACCTIM